MHTDELLDRLPGAKRNGVGWMVPCPAHQDKNPSLAVSEKNDKILLHCHAGCTVEAICAALGIEARDLFSSSNGNAAPRIIATYDYVDESGALLFQVVRHEPKAFRQRRPDGNGGWISNIEGVRRVPYRLREVLGADFILCCEGEKDCDTAHNLGLVATCNSAGAGKWRDEYSEKLRGKIVCVVADADEPGRKHAQAVAASLDGKAAALKVIELPGAKDLSEWVEHGGMREQLLALIGAAEEWHPSAAGPGVATADGWREMFHSFEDFEQSPLLSFGIEGLLQNDAATMIGGLSGQAKTLTMLSIAKALLSPKGTRLWDTFTVLEPAGRVLYLIPESTIGPFKHRLELFGLYDCLRPNDERLLVRTLSKGPTPCLSDPRILFAAKGAHVFLDTAVRFSTEGDENSASDNQRGLATDIFALLASGARCIVGAHHAPKPFARENVMRLENVLRGSGDVGAMLATCWAIKQLDPAQNIVHIECVKSRDFQPIGPFQLIGRPYIDDEGDFRIHKRPGECGALMDEQQPERNKGGGASVDAREARAANIALLREWLAVGEDQSSQQLVNRFAAVGIKVSPVTVRKYRLEMDK